MKSSMLRMLRLPGPTKANAHSWPQPGASLLLATVLTAWYLLTPTADKLIALIGATLFSFTEYTFYTITIEEPDGTIKMRPFDKRCRKGHTTVHQFLANIITIPFFIVGLINLVQSSWIRVLLFPFVIWAMEMTQGYTFIYLYGYNPAWIYRGPEAFFHGTISIGYFGYWIMMAIGVEMLVLPYFLPLVYAAVL
ncbi:hypothetical protein DFS34DRAFT_438302 [Phlyctochytrium arcticum]|nr:hypothetical protein DFS34DRAFT_438302 [Phlyctochytrium arcticum]